MPVPTSMSALGVTDGTNSPIGTEAIGTNLDNYIRATALILRRESAKGADVASATTLNVGDDGNYFSVTGTTTITGIASEWIGRMIFLRFAGVVQLTHSTTLDLPGATNITTVAGDILCFVQHDATPTWHCVFATRDVLGYRLIDSQVFTSSGTWTKPTGTIAADVEAQDGGGGGSGADASASEVLCGKGGSGGGYRRKFITSGLGATETVTVGAGGAGGAGTGSGDGGNGGASGFGSHLTTAGGVGGIGGVSGASGTSLTYFTPTLSGATPTGGDINIAGGNGDVAIRFTGTVGFSAKAGDSVYGFGAKSSSQDTVGVTGNGFGSGGGGGCSDGPTRAGADGQPGLVIVRSYA